MTERSPRTDLGILRPQWTPENRRRANRQLLDCLAALWEVVPDQRFGQLVMNLSRTDGGFADTWEWSHIQWSTRINDAYHSWTKDLENG